MFEISTIERNGRGRTCFVGTEADCHRIAKECAGLPVDAPDAPDYRGPDFDGDGYRYREPGKRYSVRPHEE